MTIMITKAIFFQQKTCSATTMLQLTKLFVSSVTFMIQTVTFVSTICPYPTIFFVMKMSSAFYLCCISYIQVHFRLDFIMETNIMNPDQTAPMEQSDLSSYCLQYRLPKKISR